MEAFLTALFRALAAALANSGGVAPAPSPLPLPAGRRLWETPDGFLDMRMMRYQLVKASGLSEVWGFGGSKSDADVVAEMAKIKGYCEEVH